MPLRTAELIVYQDPETIRKAGYVSAVKAVCLINDVMVAFTICEVKCFFTRKVSYDLSVKLHSLLLKRPYGTKRFVSYDEALAFGIELVRAKFPAQERCGGATQKD